MWLFVHCSLPFVCLRWTAKQRLRLHRRLNKSRREPASMRFASPLCSATFQHHVTGLAAAESWCLDTAPASCAPVQTEGTQPGRQDEAAGVVDTCAVARHTHAAAVAAAATKPLVAATHALLIHAAGVSIAPAVATRQEAETLRIWAALALAHAVTNGAKTLAALVDGEGGGGGRKRGR